MQLTYCRNPEGTNGRMDPTENDDDDDNDPGKYYTYYSFKISIMLYYKLLHMQLTYCRNPEGTNARMAAAENDDDDDDDPGDRKSTRLNSSHSGESRMPSSA